MPWSLRSRRKKGATTVASFSQTYDYSGVATSNSSTGVTGALSRLYGRSPLGQVTSDTDGNRATGVQGATTSSYGYDLADRLTSIAGPATASYTYDGDSLRASKTVSATTTNFTWDESGSMPMLLQDGADNYLYGPAGEPTARITSTGTTTWINQDQIGSTRLLTDSTGTKVGDYSYSTYGTTLAHTGVSISPGQ